MDIRKFFASIDHEVLKKILASYVPDQDILRLLSNIINSFNTRNAEFISASQEEIPKQVRGCVRALGLPLGNFTSQLFVNVYMNEFDQFVKHKLKAKYYIRYADDFVILSANKKELINQLTTIREFLHNVLKLELHPNKIINKTFASGIDFLGWVNFPHHKVLRTATKKRMFRRLVEHPTKEILQSYLGLLSHGNTERIRMRIRNYFL